MGSIKTQLRKPPRAAVIAGLLVLLCAAWYVKSRHSPSAASAYVNSAASEGIEAAIAKVPGNVTLTVPDTLRRDPFSSLLVFPPKVEVPVEKPVEKPAVPEPDLQQVALDSVKRDIHLSAIFTSQNPVAIVNGVAYRTGDTVLGFQVKRIDARSIVLERDGVRVLVSVQ